LGPGSYNGVRAAIALAQGWQLALGVKLIGVGSAEAVAAQAQADGFAGQAGVVIDAQRGEVYLAGYQIDAGGLRETAALRLASREEAIAREKAGDIMIGPEVDRWFSGGKVVMPRAGTVARLALSRADFVEGWKLEPIYLRETNFVKAPPARSYGH
jgi:tRNA threonylcarbamoyl adenosine modification protein YeaZ